MLKQAGPDLVLLTDLFSKGKYTQPLELTCEEISATAEAYGLLVSLHAFTEMGPGESLREHVFKIMQARQKEVGPWMKVRAQTFKISLNA